MPDTLKLADIVTVDLVERRIAARGVGPGIGRPVLADRREACVRDLSGRDGDGLCILGRLWRYRVLVTGETGDGEEENEERGGGGREGPAPPAPQQWDGGERNQDEENAWRDDSRHEGPAVAAGLDTDCNGATVGALWALQGGDIPERWTKPWNARVGLSLAGHHEIALDDLTARTVAVAQRLLV